MCDDETAILIESSPPQIKVDSERHINSDVLGRLGLLELQTGWTLRKTGGLTRLDMS